MVLLGAAAMQTMRLAPSLNLAVAAASVGLAIGCRPDAEVEGPAAGSGEPNVSQESTLDQQPRPVRGVGLSYRPASEASSSQGSEPQPPNLETLELDGFEPAVVSVPDAPPPYRVYVVAHGAGGLAEHHCSFWRGLLAERGLIVCPRGEAMYRLHPERGYYFPDHLALSAEIGALVEAVQARLADWIQPGWTYAGYSQGATMGALMVVEHKAFQQLVFIEGGGDGWTRARAERFREQGGQGVLFVCGQRSCAASAERAASMLQKESVPSRLRHAQGGGHTYRGSVGRELETGLDWLSSLRAEP